MEDTFKFFEELQKEAIHLDSYMVDESLEVSNAGDAFFVFIF